MGDDHGNSPLGWLLEALVAIVLIGTFAVYGNPGNTRGPAAEAGEMARLNFSP
jgi:hypothetical protein